MDQRSPAAPALKRLPFERRFLLDSVRCVTCAGSGAAARPSPRRTPECWNCRGLGRRITAEGRALFYAICELLGHPVENRESRIQPRHLEYIRGGLLAPGMKVQSTGWARTDPALVIASIEELPLEQRRLTFWGGHRALADAYLLFHRELTDGELDRVDVLMGERLGRGAVEPDVR